MTALRSIVRNIVREPRPCSKFSISRPFFTIHTWNVYTLLTACLNLLYCIYLYIYMLLCIYAYVCHRGSCIARICIMQPDAATLGAYVTRYISRSLGRGGKRDEKRFPSFVDTLFRFKRRKWNRFHAVPPPLDSIRACFLHMAAWLRSIGSGIWRRLATYPAIVEISTATDRQSGFRLHRVRQRDLKSFVLMNRIPWEQGWKNSNRLEVEFFRSSNGKRDREIFFVLCCEDYENRNNCFFQKTSRIIIFLLISAKICRYLIKL